MEKIFWKTVTALWQWPRVLIRPFALHFLTLRLWIGLSYDMIWNNPFVISMLAGLLMSYGWWAVIKLLFYKPRPEEQLFSNRLQKIDASSFPSVHTSNATIIAIIRARWWHQSMKLWADTFQIIPLIVSVCCICAAIALSRVALDKHYPIDVFAGMILGTTIVALLWLAYSYGYFYRR